MIFIGTNVMIYNIKLMDNGQPELDVKKDETDIIMADPHSAEIYNIDEKYTLVFFSVFFFQRNYQEQKFINVF